MILYKKPIKAQNGNYIYKSVDELLANPELQKINPLGKTTTRCLGSALDAGASCGYNWRPVIDKFRRENGFAPFLPGESKMDKGVVDAWNMYDALAANEDVKFLYDRHIGEKFSEDMLKRLPMYTIIGTGDARNSRKNYIDKNYNKRRSRHAMMVIGYLEDGTPLIYDTGKVRVGLPEKYKNQINYIVSPKDQKFFNNEVIADVKKIETDVKKDVNATDTETKTVKIDEPQGKQSKDLNLLEFDYMRNSSDPLDLLRSVRKAYNTITLNV